jgi:hypothetical protein
MTNIKKLREMMEKATPGKWEKDSHGNYIWGPEMEMIADWDDEEGCLCGRLATGLHENGCRRFKNAVNSETVKRLKNLLLSEPST